MYQMKSTDISIIMITQLCGTVQNYILQTVLSFLNIDFKANQIGSTVI